MRLALALAEEEGLRPLCFAVKTKRETIRSMEVKAPDGTGLYRGSGKEPADFTVNIRESGVYTTVVETRYAKETIHVQLEEKQL